MRWLGCFLMVALLLGCSHESKLINIQNVDRIEMVMPAKADDLIPTVKEVTSSFQVQALLEIFEHARVGAKLRDDDLVLMPGSYYIFYDGNQVIETLMFNGEDSMRVWRQWGWFEVEYDGITPYDFFELYDPFAEVEVY